MAPLFIVVSLWNSPAPGAPQQSQPSFEVRYKQAVELLGNDRDAALGRLRDLISEVRTEITRNPKNADLQFLAGNVCLVLENDADAAQFYDAAIALDPRRSAFHFKKGVLLCYKPDPEAAAREFATVVELDPRDADGWYDLGRARSAMKDSAKALEAFEKTIALSPKRSEAHFAAGCALVNLGRREDALLAFGRAADLDPKNATVHYNRGQTLQDLRREAEALTAFRKVAELDPDDHRAWTKVVQCCEALGRKEERDRARARLFELRKVGKFDKKMYARDQFPSGPNWVFVLEYFDLHFGDDDRPIRYSFRVENARDGGKYLFRITLGSYEATTEVARETGKIGPSERYWHLDRYYADDKHETFAFFAKEPSYDDVKRMGLDILAGKREAVSSTTPTSQGAVIEISP